MSMPGRSTRGAIDLLVGKPWIGGGLALALLAGLFLVIFGFAARNPRSRLYNGPLGYPALMRLLHRPIAVDCEPVRRESVETVVAGEGQTGYFYEVPINTGITGVLTEVAVMPGDTIEAGRTLFRIDPGGAVSRRSVAGGPFDMGKTQAPSGEIEVLAPLGGTVVSVDVVPGENIVNPRNRLVVIGSRPVLKAAVDQRFLGTVEIGQRAEVFLQAYPGRVFTGRVCRVDRTVASAAGSKASSAPPLTFLTWISLDAASLKDLPFASGIDGYALIRIPRESLTVPEGAVLRFSGDEALVMVADTSRSPARVRVVPVSYSAAVEGRLAVDTGLREGDLVVVSGQTALEENDAVRPR